MVFTTWLIMHPNKIAGPFGILEAMFLAGPIVLLCPYGCNMKGYQKRGLYFTMFLLRIDVCVEWPKYEGYSLLGSLEVMTIFMFVSSLHVRIKAHVEQMSLYIVRRLLIEFVCSKSWLITFHGLIVELGCTIWVQSNDFFNRTMCSTERLWLLSLLRMDNPGSNPPMVGGRFFCLEFISSSLGFH